MTNPANKTPRRQREIVIAMTREGCSLAECAEAVKITKRTVQRIRRDAGLSRPVVPGMTEEEHALARSLFDDGASVAEVARTLGRSYRSISYHYADRAWTPEQIAEHCSLIRKRQFRKALS